MPSFQSGGKFLLIMLEFRAMTRPLSFLKEVRAEMSNVSWPSRQEAIRLTLIVIGLSLLVAFFVGGLDFIFTNLTTLFLK